MLKLCGVRRKGCRHDDVPEVGLAAHDFCTAENGSEVLFVSARPFCITPSEQVCAMLVSEVVGEAWCKQTPQPEPLPIPKQTKPIKRAERDKPRKPRPFNEPKPDELS